MSVIFSCAENPSCQFEISAKAAEMSGLVRTMLEENEEACPVVPLGQLSSWALEKVVEFLKHHENDPMKPIPRPIPTNILAEMVGEWDAEFMNYENDQAKLVDLILAANYLDIPPLLELGLARYACMLKGKDAKEVCEILKIDKEMTPEEERAVRQANPWIFDTAPTPTPKAETEEEND